MTSERTRGAVLYGGAAAVLVLGGLWWARAAPRDGVDPRLAEWRHSAERLLPQEQDDLADAGTVALTANTNRELLVDVANGEYTLQAVCVGAADSRVKVVVDVESVDNGGDEGWTGCVGDRAPETFNVRVDEQLRMVVTVGSAGPVVFRYTLRPLQPGEMRTEVVD